jgi:iron complex transport system permease protein
MNRWWSTAVAVALAGLLAIVGVGVGAVTLAPGAVWEALWSRGNSETIAIVQGLRLPRVALGMLVGAALGVSGTTLQTTLRNPLAEPYLLGVSGGAAVGAVLAVAAGAQSLTLVSLCAFGGAMLAVAVVLLLGRHHDAETPTGRLLMAGVVTGAFSNATIMVLLAEATPTAQRNALWWMMGSLSSARVSDVWWLAGALLIFGGTLVHGARQLDVVALGAESAASLGVVYERVARRAFVLASLLAAATVATSGLVGFVGLIVPHLARWSGRGRAGMRWTMAMAALWGGVIVLAADAVARTVRAPAELPLGALTALLGVPFFLWQLRRTT